MTHISDEDWLLLNAFVDQELDAVASLTIERRLNDEPPFKAAHARIVATKEAVERLDTPDVSDDFYNRIAALTSPNVVPLPQRTLSKRRSLAGDWRAIAASLVMTAFLASGGTYLLLAPNPDSATEDAVVGGHLRSLLASNTVDVVSSDRHTVRPWFDAKLGISPPATDLSDKGFPLVGGRVDVVDGKTVPTLVYSHEKHLISIVALPESVGTIAERSPKYKVADGYNVVNWSHGGFQYWAVSDLDVPKLEQLVGDLISQ